MTSKPLSVKVIIGSTREGRFGDKVGTWIADMLRTREDASVEVLDLRDFEMPFFDSAMTPSYKSSPYPHEAVERFTAKIAEADAYIMVTPEYNRSTSAVLKNAIDWVYREWGDKPVAFLSYGTLGGGRAVEHLRSIAVELQMTPIREGVHFVGNDYFPVLMGHEDKEVLFAKYAERAESMLTQLMKWTKGTKAMRG
jgi:NAD(P)H-dependent FMN reductase